MNAPVKFYMDGHVHPAVTRGLKLRGVDVLTVQEAQMLGASDEEHLSLAASSGRVLFTHDDDFLKLHAAGLRTLALLLPSNAPPLGVSFEH